MRKLSLLLIVLTLLLFSSSLVAADEQAGWRLCAADLDDDGFPSMNPGTWYVESKATDNGGGGVFEPQSESCTSPIFGFSDDDANFIVYDIAFDYPPEYNPFFNAPDLDDDDVDCNDYNASINPGVDAQVDLDNADGVDRNCDEAYFYTVMCMPDLDGDGFGVNQGGFELVLGANYGFINGGVLAGGSYVDDPVIACNSRYDVLNNFLSDANHQSSEFSMGAHFLEVNDPYFNDGGFEDAYGTEASCEAVDAFEWIEDVDEFMCEGAVDCEALAKAGIDGTPYGCSAPAEYCEGSFSCSDLGSSNCGLVEGCIMNGDVCEPVDQLDYREDLDALDDADFQDGLYLDAEVFFDCDHYFAEEEGSGACISNKPSVCQTITGGTSDLADDEAPSCNDLGLSENSCWDVPGCEWVDGIEVSGGGDSCVGTYSCDELSTTCNDVASATACTVEGTSLGCGQETGTLFGASPSVCESHQLVASDIDGGSIGTIYEGPPFGASNPGYIGCSEEGLEAGCVMANTINPSGTLGSVLSSWLTSSSGYVSYTGYEFPFHINANENVYCIDAYDNGGAYESPLNGWSDYCNNFGGICADNAPYCNNLGGSSNFCTGPSGNSCSGFSSSVCDALPTCTWNPGSSTYDFCAQRYNLVPDVIEPRVDCNDGNASLQTCVEDILYVSCYDDLDDDGFYSVVDSVPEGDECDTGVLAEDIEGPFVPDEATSIPGWNEAPLGGNITDKDDDDPRETYIDCPAGEYFVWPEASVAANTQPNDFPRDLQTTHPLAKYFGGCCSGNDCMFGTVGSGENVQVATNNVDFCRSPSEESTQTTLANDESIVCSPGYEVLAATQSFPVNLEDEFYNIWLDGDTHPAVCGILGHQWTPSGHSVTQSRIDAGITFTTIPGEYPTQKGVFECCGDDSAEFAVTETCEGSTSSVSLCAPDDGDYKILDGELVDADACPDVTRSPPVWVEVQAQDGQTVDEALDAWDAFLDDDLYCCTEDILGDPSYPLCDDAQLVGGCFIADQGLNYDFSNPLQTKEWCEVTGPDPHCVIDGAYLEDTTETVTETYTFTAFGEQTVQSLPGTIDGNDIVTTPGYGYTFSANPVLTEIATYRILDAQCTEEDVTNCESSTVTICSPDPDELRDIGPVDAGTTECYVACESTTSGAQNCELLCGDFICQDYEVFYGPACTFEPTCEDSVSQLQLASTTDPGTNPVGFQTDDCVVDTDGVWTCPFGPGRANTLIRLVDALTPSDVSVTAEVPVIFEDGTNYCVPNGATAEGAVGRVECMDPNDGEPSAQNFGDYWCPIGFQYNDDTEVCEISEAICDAGPTQSPDLNCADTSGNSDILGTDDPYFGQYNEGCVADAQNSGNTYDSACCLAATFNDFEVYSEGTTSDHVRIY